MMQNLSDEFVVEKVRENFAFLTGERLPESKGKSKNDASVTQSDWFHALSFVHAMIFMQAFREAQARGLLNAVEVGLCEAVMTALEGA